MSTWQDRRFMGQAGKPVHESGRKTSFSGSKNAAPGGIATLAGATSDHAGGTMFKGAKEVHQPSRKMSSGTAGEGAKAGSPISPTTSASSGGTTGRRRSSAGSQGAMFGGLIGTRSSDEHAERRESWNDMKGSGGGFGGMFGSFMKQSGDKK